VRPRLMTSHPSLVYGPIHHKRHLNGSMAYMKHFKGKLPFVLNSHLNFVDVRDVADAHIAALTKGPNGKRIVVHTKGMWMKEIGMELRRLRPKTAYPTKVLPKWLTVIMAMLHPKLTVKAVKPSLGRHVGYDVGTSFADLGMSPTPVQDTFLDGLDSI